MLIGMEPLEIKNKRGNILKGVIYLPGEPGKVPTAIFCHGFGGCYADLEHHAKGMAQEGIACVLFDLSAFGLPVSAEYVRDGLKIDPYEKMNEFEKQVLIIHGDRDDIVPITYSKRATECYPSARLEVITGGGHGFAGGDSTHARELSLEFINNIVYAGADR